MKSEAEAAHRVHLAVKEHQPGEWILGSAWDQNLWASKQFPGAESISAAAPRNPVVLTRVDGHAIWVNRKAMEIADLNSATPDPPGGRILRDAAGRPTGVLLDQARNLVEREIPEPTAEEVQRLIKRGLEECARLGITTVHDAGVAQTDIDAYRALLRNRQMPIRAYVMIGGRGKLLDDWLARGPETGDYLTVRSIKLVADGALGSRGAAMLEPYTDDPGNRGLLILDRAAIRAVAERAIARGFQVNTHAIGDAANRAALEAYGDVLKGPNDKRFRIEHAQIVAPDDFAKFRRYSVIASMQPTHAPSDMGWAELRVGPRRIRGAYAWQTLMHKMFTYPAVPIFRWRARTRSLASMPRLRARTRWPAFWRMVPRSTDDARGGTASWTIEGAYAAFEESKKGSLEPGNRLISSCFQAT